MTPELRIPNILRVYNIFYDGEIELDDNYLKIPDYIKDDSTLFEKQPVEKLAKEEKLMAFKHEGFWKCIDNLGDKIYSLLKLLSLISMVLSKLLNTIETITRLLD